jgi:hypothetical protein
MLKMQEYNGDFLRTSDQKYRGAYYGLFEFHNFIVEQARVGKRLLEEANKKEEGEEE